MPSRAGLVYVAGLVALVACESADRADGGAGEAGAGGHAGTVSRGGSGTSAGSQAGGAASGRAGRGGAESGGQAGASGHGGAPVGGVAGDAASGEGGANAGGINAGGVNAGGDGSAGDGSAGDGSAGAGEGQAAVAYVSTVRGDILVASLDPTSGAPELLDSSPVEVDGFTHGVAVSPNGKYLFVPVQPARIETYPIAADGSLPEQPSSSAIVDDDNPMLAVALDPLGRFAYGLSPFSQTIYVFKINPDTGALTLSGEPLLVGPAPDHRNPAFVAPDPSGHFVYVTQMAAGLPTDNGIRAYSVDQASGTLTELEDSPFNEGNVVAGAIAFRPDGKFLFTSGGGVNAFAVDAASGKLQLVEGSPFSLDVSSDPWAPNITIDPQGELLYVSNFGITRHVTGFAIDAASGALEQTPGPVTTSAPYSIALGPGGRFLYVGDDNGEIAVFRVARPSGTLIKLDASPFPFGGLEPDFAFVTLP